MCLELVSGYVSLMLTPVQIKPTSFESRQPHFFLPRTDAPDVYVRALTLCCFHSLSILGGFT